MWNPLRAQKERQLAFEREQERERKLAELRDEKDAELKRKIAELERLRTAPQLNEFEVVRTDAGDFERFNEFSLKKPRLELITGERGMGKSVFAFSRAENLCVQKKAKLWLIRYPQKIDRPWIHNVDSIEEIPTGDNNVIALCDESARVFQNRRAMHKENKGLIDELVVARHRGIHYLMVSQASSLADRSIPTLVDTIAIKTPSLLQVEFERKELKTKLEVVRKDFYDLTKNGNEYWIAKPDVENLPKVYIWNNRYYGLCKNVLPSFWSERISRSYSKQKAKVSDEEALEEIMGTNVT